MVYIMEDFKFNDHDFQELAETGILVLLYKFIDSLQQTLNNKQHTNINRYFLYSLYMLTSGIFLYEVLYNIFSTDSHHFFFVYIIVFIGWALAINLFRKK